jgi:hypothetical protein
MYKEEAIELVEKSILNGENKNSKLNDDVLSIQGMSSPKFKHFLNNICSNPDNRYLEIGTFKGGTFISALWKNEMNKTPVAIDNFSEFFDIDNYNKKNDINPRECFHINTNKFLSDRRFRFIDYNCFDIDLEFNTNFDVYLYDGDHSEGSQELALTYFRPVLADVIIFIVDDWNMDTAKKGTLKGLKDWNVIKKWELKADFDGDMANWWNGTAIFVLEKGKL